VLHRLLHVAEPVIGPAEGVDDVTIVGALLDRAIFIGSLMINSFEGAAAAGRAASALPPARSDSPAID
jgi:hypothetical protein